MKATSKTLQEFAKFKVKCIGRVEDRWSDGRFHRYECV